MGSSESTKRLTVERSGDDISAGIVTVSRIYTNRWTSTLSRAIRDFQYIRVQYLLDAVEPPVSYHPKCQI